MEAWQLKQRQSLPLDVKIELTKLKIRQWYDHWNGEVYVSFSGGKDSTALLNLVRQDFPDVPAVFVDTGLEYPEIREFVRSISNVVWMRPKKDFMTVIREYGYPVVSKKVARYIRDLKRPRGVNEATRNLRLTGYNQKGKFCPSMKIPDKWIYLVDAPFKISEQCCDVMKKEPLHRYAKETGRIPITGVMASESQMREKGYMQTGCNAFNLREPISQPLGFWTEQDVLRYLRDYQIPYSTIYGEIIEKNGKLDTTGEKRTGCMFCMFGVHMEAHPNRFERMKVTHNQRWHYCIYNVGCGMVMDHMGIEYGEEPPLLRMGV